MPIKTADEFLNKWKSRVGLEQINEFREDIFDLSVNVSKENYREGLRDGLIDARNGL